MGRAIGVLSLKGGVGKTSVVVALGDAIAGFGKKVLLIDGNLTAPNLGLHFNILNPDSTLHELLDRSANIKDAVIKLDKFDIIPAALFSRKNVSPLKLKEKVRYLKKKYDYILIDSAPSLDEESLSVVLAADELLVVVTPDHLSLASSLKAIKRANQRGTRINGLILNKVYKKKFELSIKDVEKTTDVPVLAVIPHDVKFVKALSQFKSYISSKPRSKGAKEYKKLAGVLVGEKYKPRKASKYFITPNRQEINREVFYKQVFK
jgi:MinD-like ATPase involved in chromosome partitioning or flagellar assembly